MYPTGSFDDHLQNKIASRLEKEKDKPRVVSENAAEICAVFDLQQVLPLLPGDMSSLYYKRKLSLQFYNFQHGERDNATVTCGMRLLRAEVPMKYHRV